MLPDDHGSDPGDSDQGSHSRETVARERYRAGVMLGGLVLLAIVVAALAVLVSVAVQTNRLAADARDCATPGGDCYARTQAANEQRAQQTRRIVLSVGICARKEADPDRLERCVARLLDSPDPVQVPPTPEAP